MIYEYEIYHLLRMSKVILILNCWLLCGCCLAFQINYIIYFY